MPVNHHSLPALPQRARREVPHDTNTQPLPPVETSPLTSRGSDEYYVEDDLRVSTRRKSKPQPPTPPSDSASDTTLSSGGRETWRSDVATGHDGLFLRSLQYLEEGQHVPQQVQRQEIANMKKLFQWKFLKDENETEHTDEDYMRSVDTLAAREYNRRQRLDAIQQTERTMIEIQYGRLLELIFHVESVPATKLQESEDLITVAPLQPRAPQSSAPPPRPVRNSISHRPQPPASPAPPTPPSLPKMPQVPPSPPAAQPPPPPPPAATQPPAPVQRPAPTKAAPPRHTNMLYYASPVPVVPTPYQVLAPKEAKARNHIEEMEEEELNAIECNELERRQAAKKRATAAEQGRNKYFSAQRNDLVNTAEPVARRAIQLREEVDRQQMSLVHPKVNEGAVVSPQVVSHHATSSAAPLHQSYNAAPVRHTSIVNRQPPPKQTAPKTLEDAVDFRAVHRHRAKQELVDCEDEEQLRRQLIETEESKDKMKILNQALISRDKAELRTKTRRDLLKTEAVNRNLLNTMENNEFNSVVNECYSVLDALVRQRQQLHADIAALLGVEDLARQFIYEDEHQERLGFTQAWFMLQDTLNMVSSVAINSIRRIQDIESDTRTSIVLEEVVARKKLSYSFLVQLQYNDNYKALFNWERLYRERMIYEEDRGLQLTGAVMYEEEQRIRLYLCEKEEWENLMVERTSSAMRHVPKLLEQLDREETATRYFLTNTAFNEHIGLYITFRRTYMQYCSHQLGKHRNWSATKIQSFWRMCIAKREVYWMKHSLRMQQEHDAAVWHKLQHESHRHNKQHHQQHHEGLPSSNSRSLSNKSHTGSGIGHQGHHPGAGMAAPPPPSHHVTLVPHPPTHHVDHHVPLHSHHVLAGGGGGLPQQPEQAPPLAGAFPNSSHPQYTTYWTSPQPPAALGGGGGYIVMNDAQHYMYAPHPAAGPLSHPYSQHQQHLLHQANIAQYQPPISHQLPPPHLQMLPAYQQRTAVPPVQVHDSVHV